MIFSSKNKNVFQKITVVTQYNSISLKKVENNKLNKTYCISQIGLGHPVY